MKLEELYNHYDCNWVRVSREIGYGNTTVILWRKMGFIPRRAQQIIERRLDGLFKADKEN